MTEMVVSGELKREQFKDREDIVSVIIEDETSVPEECFSGCKNLVSVTLGEKVEEIECYAFEDCISLKTVNVQNERISISSGAFKNCVKLVDNGFLSRACDIFSEAFQGCVSLKTVFFGKHLKDLSVSAFLDVPFTTLSIEPNNKYFFIEKDFLIQPVRCAHKKTKYKALAYIGNKINVTVPEKVNILSNMCFKLRECSDRIREITLPVGLNTLEDDEANDDEFLMDEIASMRESGNSVIIPQALSATASSVFDKCRKLEKIHVSRDNQAFCSKKGCFTAKTVEPL